MHPLQKQFHDYVRKGRLFEKEDKVLLAVSGGLDSMVMLDLFYQSGYRFSVAHCNFGLRGAESDKDAELVAQWTLERDVLFHVKKIALGAGSTQLEARKKRYDWFNELCEEHGFQKIATAHHLNDSLETTLINLTRGTGMRGLKGIARQNGRVIRPLLFATRKQLAAYAHFCQLRWREDSSNSKTDYDRNKIRLEVIPKLQEMNPSLVETYANTKERMEWLYDLVRKKVTEIKAGYFDEVSGELKLEWMKEESDLVFLSELLTEYGFNYTMIKDIGSARGNAGKIFPGKEYTVSMDRTSLFIQKKEEASEEEDLLIYEAGTYEFLDKTFSIEELLLQANELDRGLGAVLIAREKVTFPIKIRKWREGDVMTPLGMKGRKKVSDILIDSKVPLAKKGQVLVVEIDHEIVWVVGYRMSEVFKVAEGTVEVVRIAVEEGW